MIKLQQNENLYAVRRLIKKSFGEIDEIIHNTLNEIESEGFEQPYDIQDLDYQGKSIDEFLSEYDNTVDLCYRISNALVSNTEVNPERLIFVIPGLIMVAEGDCYHCGSDDTYEMDRVGTEVGGRNTPVEFTGTVRRYCRKCQKEFEKDY